MTLHSIRIRGDSFVDEHGRTLMLRGVNLGGSSKVPFTPNGATHLLDGFTAHREVSFIGRPFPLAQAEEHFSRLRSWGMNVLRFLVTWEALEHTGPGVFDDEYIDYVHAVAEKAAAYGLSLFIDPHQDTWSRWSGGDGAPGWTLEAAGFDLAALHETGAAFTHQFHGDPFPRMIWPTNSGKLAAATMFTLFFGGAVFAPRVTVEGEGIQEYLQRHYVEAMARLARRLADLPNVLGYDTMNEPLPGYIGWKDLNAPGGFLTLGESPSALQGMALADGIPQEIGVYEMGALRLVKRGTHLMNTARRRAWRDDRPCIWRAAGVWDIDERGAPVLLRPDYFHTVGGREVDFAADFHRPFIERFIAAVRAPSPGTMIFLEPQTNHLPCRWDGGNPPDLVFAPHWYDELLIATKRYFSLLAIETVTHRLVVGARAIRRSFARQLSRLKEGAHEQLGKVPTLLGEFGIPFDMNRARAFQTGDFAAQSRALDRSFQAIEANFLHCTIWNYTADNSNERGDQWNGEDFSVYSAEGQRRDSADRDAGGRALSAFVRPYPRATAGDPLRVSYDYRKGRFFYSFRQDAAATAPTEIFLPARRYGPGCRIVASDGTWERRAEEQLLVFHHDPAAGRDHWIRVTPGRQPTRSPGIVSLLG